MQPRVITSNQELFSCYHDLKEGDIILGRIRLAGEQEHLLLDLVSRNIRMIPSATSQLCSRSKVFQTSLLRRFMLNHTLPVYSMQDMVSAVTEYGHAGLSTTVCKLDRANGGQGILRFASIEDIFSQATLGALSFPFVIQPFIRDSIDIRVVILGDRIEAYQRYNSGNFRHNLHCGGVSRPCEVSRKQLDFCRQAMERGGFPHAHTDLMVLPDGTFFLSEINLRGGLRGAQMGQQEYLQMVEQIYAAELERLLNE